MSGRRAGYAAWLLLAAILYFFENSAGTRIILACSAVLPLVPAIRRGFFAPARKAARQAAVLPAVSAREEDAPGDVRPYQPGDPPGRVHWKLSAKRDTLLVRQPIPETVPAPGERALSPAAKSKGDAPRGLALWGAGVPLLCALLLFTLPQANQGARALCNRLFAASEAVNAYAYDRLPGADERMIPAAAALLAIAGIALAAVTVLSRSRLLPLGVMAACTAFQAYFGLALPGWISVPLYAALALLAARNPRARQSLLQAGAAVLAVAALILLLWPGVDPATESASERLRDWLSPTAQGAAGALPEAPESQTEVRRAHVRSLLEGDQAARPLQEYRLAAREEQQVSKPHWIDYLRIVLLLLLAVAVVILPFLPFLALNARRKRALENRRAFQSADVNAAVCAIFQQVAAQLEIMGYGDGGLPYRAWGQSLCPGLPRDYAQRFDACAALFEQAAYGAHPLAEPQRRQALDLLEETRQLLWNRADLQHRLRLALAHGLEGLCE
ncbi:MAG: DUF58 domain-containing protein [Clostridia bacterium]|nr:DUF58 domain-containing protein [Clostridia bacterium]